MVDVVNRATRSRIMASIRGKDTAPELVLRRFLHRMGFRYTLHRRGLAGRPDIVLPKYCTVIFVHGCFWHQHAGCRAAVIPASNAVFWRKKLAANVRRDRIQLAALQEQGWRVGVFWECVARKGAADQRVLRDVVRWLVRGRGYREFPDTTGRRTRGLELLDDFAHDGGELLSE